MASPWQRGNMRLHGDKTQASTVAESASRSPERGQYWGLFKAVQTCGHAEEEDDGDGERLHREGRHEELGGECCFLTTFQSAVFLLRVAFQHKHLCSTTEPTLCCCLHSFVFVPQMHINRSGLQVWCSSQLRGYRHISFMSDILKKCHVWGDMLWKEVCAFTVSDSLMDGLKRLQSDSYVFSTSSLAALMSSFLVIWAKTALLHPSPQINGPVWWIEAAAQLWWQQ